MKALTLDDLLPLDEFAGRRREFFEAHVHYVDRYRRVRLGPRLTLIFENRQTLWFRLQDVLRIARVTSADRVQEELAIYNRLLPGRDCLQAALLLAIPEESRLTEELALWQGLRGSELTLHLGDARYPADLLTCRPEDRCIGASHLVQFVVDDEASRVLADVRYPAYFSISLPAYAHESAPLGDEVRQSLLDDLVRSERDE